MMFLPEDKWSSRYEEQFYTIRMKGYVTIYSPSELPTSDLFNDDDNMVCSIFGLCNNSKKFPAVYYQIQVFRGPKSYIVLRRYSQFVTLCKKLDPCGTLQLKKSLPPKSHPLLFTEVPLTKRILGLYNFLNDILTRQECVNNVLIEQFLELNREEET